MLVLKRRLYERIQIGPDVFVTVVRIDGESVRLGIDAPLNLDIARLDPDPTKPNGVPDVCAK